MINLDTRLLEQTEESEMWLLLHLAKRLGKEVDSVYPSNATLLAETGWHIEKLQRVKKSLVEKGLVKIKERRAKGQLKQSSNIYVFKTDKIGYYVSAKNEEVEILSPTGNSDTPPLGKSDPSPPGKSDREVLTNEVLTNEDNTASQVLLTFYEIRKVHEPKSLMPRMTPARKKMILARKKDFDTHWPGRDFQKACRFMFEYKAREWSGTDIWKNFKIETMFRDIHFVDYLETAEENNGVPPAPKAKNQPPPTTAPPSVFKNLDERQKQHER